MPSFFIRNGFLLALITVLLGAWITPPLPDLPGRPLLSPMLVAGIFLCSGLSLRTRELGDGIRNFRLHLFIQTLSLGITPLFCLALDPLWHRLGLSPDLRLGLLVLSALPTTITSCVALTAAASGNQSGALVNAGLGNLLGVFLTPLWLLIMAGTASARIELLPILQKLGLLILIPVLAGQLLQTLPRLRPTPAARRRLTHTGQLLLLALLFFSFQNAFRQNAPPSPATLLTALLLCLALHLLLLAAAWHAARLPPFRLSRPDRICALFCASQKTLALGLPLITLCFPNHPGLPLIALPLLIYHPLQMLIAGLLTHRLNP